MATLAPSDGFRPAGQLSLVSLQLAAASVPAWQYQATGGGVTTKANGSLVATMATDGSLTTTGGLSLAKTLAVTGAASVTGQTSLAGVSASGPAQLNGATTIAASLTQTGAGNAVSLAGPLSVANAITQTGTGAVTLAGPAFLSGATQLSSTLTQTGSGNAVSIAGPTTLTNSLTVSGAFSTSLGGPLSVTGASTLNGATTVAAALTQTGASNPVSLAGTLSSGVHTIASIDANSNSLLALAAAATTNTFVLGQTPTTGNASYLKYVGGATPKTQLGTLGGQAFSVDNGGNAVVLGTTTCTQPLILANAPSFTGNYPELANRPVAAVYGAAGPALYNTRIYAASGTTSGTTGTVTLYPTTTGSSGGTPLFSNILSILLTPVRNSTAPNNQLSAQVLTATTAQVVAFCGNQYVGSVAPAGTVVYCIIIGN